MSDPTPDPPPAPPTPSNGTPAAAGAAGGPASSPRRDRMLSELASELRAVRDEHRRGVAQLRADLAGLSTLVGENADLLGQVMPRVGDLDVELADLADRVDDLATAVTTNAGGPGEQAPALVDWPSLSADAAAAEWQALGDWVAGVLGPFYEITRAQLPDCWALHRPAVLELVWLRRVYVAAHRPDAAPTAAADWHTRWRPAALAGIAAAIPETWCRPGEHYVDRDASDRRRTGRTPPPPGPPPPHVPGQRPGPELYSIGTRHTITTAEHWGQGFQIATAADVAWRRQRDAAAGDPPAGA